MLRYLTAGESHGKGLAAILEGMPAGLRIDTDLINRELQRRQAGYGRGKRMEIEKDTAAILSGVRSGQTLGGPIAIQIINKDATIDELPMITRPRPGHADLAGALKYGFRDMRNVLERSSARETAARVAIGAMCKVFLKEFEIDITSHVINIGGVTANTKKLSFGEIKALSVKSPVMCADETASKSMMAKIDKAIEEKDSLGGIFEVLIIGVPVGLGSYVHWDRKLDADLAKAVMSIQAVKSVEIGMGLGVASKSGSQVHDEIFYDQERGFYRKTNNAGGLEGGMSNGEPIILRAAMKPIATLGKPLKSVDINTKQKSEAAIERADVCAVPAAGVVAENACAVEMAGALLDKFGGDSLNEIKRNYHAYLEELKKY